MEAATVKGVGAFLLLPGSRCLLVPPHRKAALSPPSTISECPVTYDAASEHSHTAASAASSGRPIRPLAIRSVHAF
jgi:hypothetical protein